jgi:hypothetical protein
VTRYVLADLEEVGAELGRRAAEIVRWLDSVADGGVSSAASAVWGESGGAADDAALAAAVAQVDLVCYQALSAAASRLASAADSVAACAGDMRGVDGALAARICRGSG